MKKISNNFNIINFIWIIITNLIILSLYWKDFIVAVLIMSIMNYFILIAKQKILSYNFGIITSILFAYLSFKNELYYIFILNIFYCLPMQIIGFLYGAV